MSLPTIRSVSAIHSNVGGGLDQAWPADTEVGDDGYVVCESANETVTAPSGFADVLGGPPTGTGTAGGTAATRLTVFHRRAATLPMPTITMAAAGDHLIWFAFFVRGGPLDGTPWEVASASVAASATTAVSVPGGTTTEADCLIALLACHGIDTSQGLFSGWANAALGSLTVWMNDSGLAGNGGGLALVTGTKAVAGTFGATTATLSTASVQGRLMLALRGQIAAPALTNSDFCCGAECGADAGLPGPMDFRHWHAEVGSPMVSQTTIARTGGRAWRCTPSGAESYRRRVISGSKRWVRYYIQFPTLPTVDLVLLRLVAASGSPPELRYRAATTDLVGAVGTAVTLPQSVQAGVWYRIDLAGDVSGSTRTMKLTAAPVSGVAADRGTASAAASASVLTALEIGGSIGTAVTADVVWDDLRTGENTALYPVGAGAIVGLTVAADGVHVAANGAFRDEMGNPINFPNTTTWTFLQGLLRDTGGRVQADSPAAGDYLEWLVGGMPAATAIAAVELVSVHTGGDVSPHKQTLRLLDGGTTVDVFTDADFSEITPVYHSKHYLVAPSGAAWTTALVNALKFRWGSSWTAPDTVGPPRLGGIVLEVDHTPAPPPPAPVPRTEQHPVYTYATPGTYTVRLRVTDNEGLTDEVTHLVTVPAAGIGNLVAALAGVGSMGATLELVPAVVLASTLTLELREGGVLRAIRYLEPFVPGPGESTRWQMLLTDDERATIVTWNNLELWLIATGGTRAIRVTRFEMRTPG